MTVAAGSSTEECTAGCNSTAWEGSNTVEGGSSNRVEGSREVDSRGYSTAWDRGTGRVVGICLRRGRSCL